MGQILCPIYLLPENNLEPKEIRLINIPNLFLQFFQQSIELCHPGKTFNDS
jgi:hypothetical protein